MEERQENQLPAAAAAAVENPPRGTGFQSQPSEQALREITRLEESFVLAEQRSGGLFVR